MMKSKPKTYVVSQMIKDYEKGVGQKNRLVFDCPLQRPEGQWSKIAQSLLIHTILQDLLVPNVFIVQNGADDFEPMTVLDGRQRMTIVYNYVTNGFALHKDTPAIELTVPEMDENGNLVKNEIGVTKTHIELVDIKGKRFDKLSKEFQDKIKNFEFGVTMITQATKKELEEQIFRLNNGKTPTATQKAFMKSGISVTEAIKSDLLTNDFFTERFGMSVAQSRGGEDMKCAFHTLALLTNAEFNKLTSGDLTKIAENMKADWENNSLSSGNIKYCNELMNNLNEWLPDNSEFVAKDVLTTIHIPIMVMNADKATQMIDDGEITVEQYKDFLKQWVNDGFYDTEYRECSEGSPSDKRNIERRIGLMEEKLCEFAKKVAC